jgi:hypothetical protein
MRNRDMNRDQFQKWIDEHGTGQRENKSCNDIDWILVTMKDTWIALFEYVNGSYIPYIQCKDKEHALSYINVLERLSVPFDVI